jgi:uncharacterized protein (TIGR03437 family)
MVVLVSTVAAQNVITTIAGVDPVFSSNGGPALSAPLGYINGVTSDSSGNVYFTDPLQHLVLRVSSTGVLTVIAGNGIAGYSGDGGPATSAAIAASDNPEQYVPLANQEVSLGGIALDAQGDVYFGDGNYVRMVSAAGIITTVAGGGTSASLKPIPALTASLGIVNGLVFDHAGNLYFAEGNHIRELTPAGTLMIYAGTAAAGYSGDNGPATSAQLSQPSGIAFDAQENLYIADGNTVGASTLDARVRKITPAGIITTVAGGGTVTPANRVAPLALNLTQLGGVAVDPAGNLYVFSPFYGTLLKLTASGGAFTTTTLVTNPNNAVFTANVPATSAYVASERIYDNSNLSFDAKGNLYLAASGAGYLCKIDTTGFLTVIAGNGDYAFAGDGGPAVAAEIQGPASMAQGPDGTVYFVDSQNFRVRAISPAGTINTVLSTANFTAIGNLEALRAVVVDPVGNLYALLRHRLIELTTAGNVVVIVNQSGNAGYSGDGGPAIDATMSDSMGLARDSAGNLYIVDATSCVIRKVTTDLKIQTIAGTGSRGFTPDGGAAMGNPLATPSGILLDGLGGIYFQEAPVLGIGHDIIRYITPQGILKTIAGNGQGGFSGDGQPATQASMRLLEAGGMQLDKAGNLYLADGFNNRVRVISPAGIINTYAGNGTAVNGGDGGTPQNASLVVPQGLLFDSSGDLLISDIAGNRIRSVLASPPAISISPQIFTFHAQSGGALSAVQQLTVTSPVNGVAFTVSPQFEANWITADITSGVTPEIVNLRVDPTNLAQGSYKAAVLIESPLANPSAAEMTVTANIGAAVNPQLAVDRKGLSFTYPRNPTLVEAQNIQVSNSGSGPLAFSATSQINTGANWLQISPASGSVTPNSPANVSVTTNPAGLGTGTYTGSVTISSAATGQSDTVNVTLTVSSLDQAIRLSHSGLSFTAVAGGGVIAPRTFTVNNIGRGTMNFTVSTSTLSGGSGWLSATPATGSVTAGGATQLVTVSVNATNLAAGFYYGQVRIDAPDAANTPHVVTVALNVLAAGTDPGPVIFPSDSVVTAAQGAQPPGAVTLNVYNVSATPQNFVTSVTSPSGEGFSILPAGGTLAVGQPATIVVQPLTANLNPGVYDAAITFQFSDGKLRQAGIRTIVTAAEPSTPAIVQPHATAGCAPTQLVPVITVLGQSFSVPAAWPVALDTVVTDDCGNPVNNGTVEVSFSNSDPPLSLTPDGQGGLWDTTWVSGNTSGAVTLTVTATDPSGKLTGTRQITGGLGDAAPAPVLSVAVSSASFAQNVPLSPLSIISIAGQNLSDGTASASVIPLGTTLAGATAVMAGYELPLYYASGTLINAVSPGEIAVNTSHQIVVQQGNTLSVPISVDVAASEPAVFLFPGPGDPAAQGAIVNGLNYVVAQPGTPVTVGDLLAIFCTGLGAVNPTVPDGAGAPSPPANTIATPAVTIGGQPASIVFSGLTPGSVGLYQINVYVPAGVTPGNNVPVVVSIAGQTGPPVTIAVK